MLGALQGATELFPVSSLGHAVVLPALLRWSYRESDPTFLPFLVLLHLGTAGALVILYRREWAGIAVGFVRASLRGRIETDNERLAMLLLVGTVPTGVLGVLFQSQLQRLFAAPRLAAVFLILNGCLLLGAEMLRRRDERRSVGTEASREEQESHYIDVSRLSFRVAALVGLCQSLALLPGISRSGATMAGGLMGGLRHQEAVRFAFLLATPIIAAAGVLKVPDLVRPGTPWGAYLAGGVMAAVAAYLSATFLVRYFRVGRLDPYGLYCAALGVLTLILLR